MPPVIQEPTWMRQAAPSLLADDERVKAYFDRHMNPLSPRWRWHTGCTGGR